MHKHKIIPALLGFAVVVASFWIETTPSTLVNDLRNRIEWIAYDMRLNATLPEVPPPLKEKILIIDIDEQSIKEQGHWPWPRSKLARLVDKLSDLGVSVTAFDILFAEPEQNVAQVILNHLKQDEDKPIVARITNMIDEMDGDAKLVSSISDRDVVLGFALHNEKINAGDLPKPVTIQNQQHFQPELVRPLKNYTSNLANLQSVAAGTGFFTIMPDDDGIYRRAPMLLRYENRIFPSLALETARLFLLEDGIEVNAFESNGQYHIEEVVLGKGLNRRIIPLDSDGNALIPFRGPAQSFTYLSATDVLQDRVPKALLENAIVFVGATAQGLYDLRATPVSNIYPGVEVHANILSAILNTSGSREASIFDQKRSPHELFPYRPAWTLAINVLLIFTLGFILSIGYPFISPITNLIITFALSAILINLNFLIWKEYAFIVTIISPIVMIFGISILNMTYGFLVESQRRLKLKQNFAQYVPPDVVEEMTEHPENYSDAGESRELTALFADIRGFTTISESLSASDLRSLLNRFFTPMTEIIFRNRGTIDKYVGDMIMAFWGAPIKSPDHAIDGVKSALLMIEKVKALKAVFQKEGLPEINIGIGLNTGIMHVGDMGSEFRKAYTILGDAVNLASRMEASTKFYGVSILVGENTYEKCKEVYAFRFLDLVKVKGKHQAIRAYEPLCLLTDVGAELAHELKMQEEALKHYWARRWNLAAQIFSQLEQDNARKVYQLYLDRVETLRDANLGDDWDGVYVREEK